MEQSWPPSRHNSSRTPSPFTTARNLSSPSPSPSPPRHSPTTTTEAIPTGHSAPAHLQSPDGRPDQSASPAGPSSPAFDVRLLEYVSLCDAHLICPICHCPFDKPARLDCDHVFCSECLERAVAEQISRGRAKTCPSCRRALDHDGNDNGPHRRRSMPRILLRMLDDLVVRCPNRAAGCGANVTRGEVDQHVKAYCEYTAVECAAGRCSMSVLRKDRDKGCDHYPVSCEHCAESLLPKDMPVHLEEQCPKRFTTCTACDAVVLHSKLKHHLENVCPATPVSCPGMKYGCSWKALRAEVEEHARNCPIATLTPFLTAQQDRIAEQEKSQAQLRRKVDILEGGLAAIHTLIYENPLPAADGNHQTDPSQAGLSSAASSEDNGSVLTEVPPFDSSIHHLLSLHESLREEVSRVADAVTALDARASMMLINEEFRAKQDMAHTNAVISSMRAQLHWLASARLQAQNRLAANTHGGTGSGTNAAVLADLAGPRAASAQLQPMRTSSDTFRQDTKL